MIQVTLPDFKTTGHIGPMTNTYQAVETTGRHDLTLVDRELLPPSAGQVRIKVSTCGICHTDVLAVDLPREHPVVPGHEIVGVIDAVGDGVHRWRAGDRVGVGFLGGHCGECEQCRRGDFVNCTDQPRTGIDVDGGFAEYAYARASGLVAIPDGLSDVDAAPLLCAGLTTLQALRRVHTKADALVAVQGIGGLGHLGVQYAHRLGYRVAAIARGTGKAELAAGLGADHHIDSAAGDPGAALLELGGADAVIATAASGASMSPLIKGLTPNGRMIVVGAALDDPLAVATTDLIFGTRSVTGSLTGSAIENEDNLRLSLRLGVRPLTEALPLADAAAGYDRMMSGAARFRVVLEN